MKPISRRTVLRGLGTAIALPWLEAMAPAPARGRRGRRRGRPGGWRSSTSPTASTCPTGRPRRTGTGFELPEILEPLAPFKDDLLVLTGLTQDGAFAHGDGGGDHARSLASFLTGTHPLKTAGADIQAGVSVDQVAAQKIGKPTRFPSLELGIDRGRPVGQLRLGL